MGLDQTLLISNTCTALAFVAEAWLFHRFSELPFTPLSGVGYFWGAFGVYAALRSSNRRSLALLLAVLGGTLIVGRGQVQAVSAGLAFLLLLAYPGYLRRHLILKPITIAAVWLLTLHAFTGARIGWLYAQQGLLLVALTLPFDVASASTDRILTFPRAFGIRGTRRVYYALLGASAVGISALPAPLCFALGGTIVSAGLLMLWPPSLTVAGVCLYDALLVFQALLVQATDSLVLLPLCVG